MKNRFVRVFSLGSLFGFLLWYFLTLPLIYTVEFEIRGTNGDEAFSLTKNYDLNTIIPQTRLVKNKFQAFSITTIGPIFDLRLHCMNFGADDQPRMITIQYGVVRVYRKNLLGNFVDASDWLTSEVTYRSPDGEDILASNSKANSGARAGYIGWNGYYELRPPY